MPNCGSWDGKWSGSSRIHTCFRSFHGKKGEEKAKSILEKGHFSYNFGDGWRASIEPKHLTPSELRAFRRLSDGFCGYDWMVDSIVLDGEIYGPTQPKPKP